MLENLVSSLFTNSIKTESCKMTGNDYVCQGGYVFAGCRLTTISRGFQMIRVNVLMVKKSNNVDKINVGLECHNMGGIELLECFSSYFCNEIIL